MLPVVADFVPALSVSLVVVLMSTPLVIRLAGRLEFYDLAGGHKSHLEPTPLLGGLALAAGTAAGSVYQPGSLEIALVSGAFLLLIIGLIDDRYDLSATPKLIAQILALAVFFAFSEFDSLQWWELLVIGLWMLAIPNSFNLLDNHDGVAAGIGVTTALGLVVALTVLELSASPAAPAIIAGACGGFLVFNRPSAHIFMGDAGSLPLGFCLAAMALPLYAPNWRAATVIGCLFAIPILDTSLVVISRCRRRVNPLTTPGRDHLAHRLTSLGLNPSAALVVLVGASSISTLLGIAVAAQLLPARPIAMAGGICGGLIISLLERRALLDRST